MLRWFGVDNFEVLQTFIFLHWQFWGALLIYGDSVSTKHKVWLLLLAGLDARRRSEAAVIVRLIRNGDWFWVQGCCLVSIHNLRDLLFRNRLERLIAAKSCHVSGLLLK